MVKVKVTREENVGVCFRYGKSFRFLLFLLAASVGQWRGCVCVCFVCSFEDGEGKERERNAQVLT